MTLGVGDRALGQEEAAAPARPIAKAEIARALAPAPKWRREIVVTTRPLVVSGAAGPSTVAPPTITVKNFRTDNAKGKTPSARKSATSAEEIQARLIVAPGLVLGPSALPPSIRFQSRNTQRLSSTVCIQKGFLP